MSALPLFDQNQTLYLNNFREEPAISEFDWPFTPHLQSSAPIATDVGSVLQKQVRFLQPAGNEITQFRVK